MPMIRLLVGNKWLNDKAGQRQLNAPNQTTLNFYKQRMEEEGRIIVSKEVLLDGLKEGLTIGSTHSLVFRLFYETTSNLKSSYNT